jgi:alpha-glucosidase
VPEGHRVKAVDVQADDENSVLAHYRAMLALRRAHPALVSGSIRFLEAQGNLLVFIREGGGQKLLCVFNFGSEAAGWTVPPDLGLLEAVELAGCRATLEGGVLALPGLHGFIGRLG